MPAPHDTPTLETLRGLDDVLALIEALPGPDAWRAELDAMRVRPGVYMNDGEAVASGGSEGGAKGGEGSEGSSGSDGAGAADDDDDEDGEPADLAAARKALARMRRERKAEQAERAKADAKAKADAGKYRELYEEEKAAREKADAERERDAKAGYIRAAGSRLKAHDADDLVAVLGADALEDIDSEADAERELKRLRKRKPHLFAKDGPRQMKGGGRSNDDDDDNADDDDGKKNRPKVSRLRAGLEKAQKERAGSAGSGS